MGSIKSKSTLIRAGLAACALAFTALAQGAAVQLTALPQTTTLPDGQVVKMWGYRCGSSPTAATCTAMNGAPQAGGTAWQPPLITVPAGTPLTISLTNQLSFGGEAGQQIPTSIVIDGQVGGGLGTERATMPSPTHAPQGTTWPGTLGTTDPATLAINLSGGGKGYVTPPAVSITGGGGSGATAVATIANGMVTGVVVSSPGSGYTSTPTVAIAPPPCTINGTTCVLATATMDLSILNSTDGSATFVPPAQADRVRSFAKEVQTGTTVDLTWATLRPGTYLLHSGTQPSIQHPMGLYGVLVVTDPASTVSVPSAYGTTFDKDIALLLSEIDPVQNAAVDTAVRTSGFSDGLVYDAQTGKCGDPSVHNCYPPAVNYSPTYYLINGVSFDRTSMGASSIAVPTAGAQKNLLLRIVNAGLRLHVPTVIGSNMTLVAEDGNKLPPSGPRVQSSLSMPAGKTQDVVIKPKQTTAGTYDSATYAVFDRQLSLSTSNQRDGGMQAYLVVGTGAASGTAGSSSSATTASAASLTYYCIGGSALSVTDPGKGVLAGAVGANGVSAPTAYGGAVNAGNLTLQSNGTFVYNAPAGACGGSFAYMVNGTLPRTATIAQCDATTQDAGCVLATAATVSNITFTSNVSSRFISSTPGVLASVTNYGGGLALSAVAGTQTGGTVTLNADGSFVAMPGAGVACPAGSVAGAKCMTFDFQAKNTQGRTSNTATATVVFNPASNLAVNVWDAPSMEPGSANPRVQVTDYRWIIEEDRTFWMDPKCQVNSTGTRLDSRGMACPPLPVESLGYSFHTANMPVVAQGCVGPISCEAGQTQGGTPVACDVGNGICRIDAAQKTQLLPGTVYLDPNKRYFISVLPGDGVNPTIGGAGGPDENGKPFSIATACGPFTGPTGAWEPGGPAALCGHAMGGSSIAYAPGAGTRPQVDIALQQTPLPTARIAVFVFQDDNPLNGENDAGGGVDILAPNEPGLGGFEIKLFDQAGGLGDATGQITYDMFNQPVSNALANKLDPITGLDACPITARGDGLVGMIPTCPKYESDGVTVSPLAGQVVIANLYPGLYEVVATPAADRIARGEEWLQTNTLDGGKPHEAFIKPNEPGYFQEFGPGNFHVSVGFANPAIINARKDGFCNSAMNTTACNNTLTVQVTNNHMSRTPDQRTFSSETYDHFGFTQCYVSIGPADAEDFAFQKCNPDGTVTFNNMPGGVFKMTVFDQWNDIMLDGLVGTVVVDSGTASAGKTTTKTFPVTQWRTNLFTRTFIDQNGDGVSQPDEPGLALVNTNIHYRDGSIGFFNNTDLAGYAGFNEVFPFMNWLVVETSSTRFKPTGVHTVYDAGGPVDCSVQGGGFNTQCAAGTISAFMANTDVRVPLPTDLRVPGAKYCDQADCLASDAGNGLSTGSVFPPQAWGTTQGWQGLLGQDSFIEFGVKPFKPASGGQPAENGGISGMVIYASTRPFDDPALSLQLSWEPGVPRVKINLYSKTVDANGNDVLSLVDTTTSASWDDWAQGFRRDASGNLIPAASGGFVPNMNCPGQTNDSPFFATLQNSKQWLDPDRKALAYKSQFKCYDGWSQLNQIQPAPYDGLYKFPSIVTVAANGKPAQTNCTTCITNPDDGNPMLPAGKYVVEVILPQGYELVKEEDKNILLGDVYVAPVSQQFAGFGNIFIMPDQAAVNAYYNPSNPGGLNKTTNLGASPRHEGDTGSVEQFWPCVGAERVVPDLNSLFPGAGQAAPFAGAKRRLCDRKEVTLTDESAALAKFFIFSSTHIAGHFAGTITNDFASEFDPFSPQFGEKFGPPNLPVGMRDYNGAEVTRVYSDQWGIYNGLYFSSYSVNPPNPTGYVPQMSISCMNDPGPIPKTNAQGQYVDANGSVVASRYDAAKITDPAYNPAYSNFCYEMPFMPGFTAYMDTPVIPTMSFADGYNLPDSEYPDGTPAILKVVNSSASEPQGPWVHAAVSAQSATAAFTISGVNSGDSISSITVNAVNITGVGAIICNPACASSILQATRNNNLAQLVVTRINGSGSGYTATRVNATVTITAPATGSAPNGYAVVVNTTNVAIAPASIALAGGQDPSSGSMNITITAMGDKVVQNPNFSGPNSTTAPYNQKTITRHYGFGNTVGTVALVGADGVARNLTGVTWSDMQITGTVPGTLPNCTVQQRNQPSTQCGQLVITRGDNGKQSIDAITVTVGGRAPWVVAESGVTAPAGQSVSDYGAGFGRMGPSPIQVAIDSADPGDLILVTPGTYRENLIFWKPVRLQGVGAAAVTINADAHPAGKMDQWRRQMNCAFGLDLDGVPNLGNATYDQSGKYSCPNAMHMRVDRIPFEAIVGWDASGNGNLAQVLQEPTLMGAYEGAGITVLGRGVAIPAGSVDFWGQAATGGAGAFADGSVYIGGTNAYCNSASTTQTNGRDYGTSNFNCNPSRIDGMSILNSSQGGGGVFIHGWAHNLDVGNTRISGNHGTLAGAINLGNGEIPDAFINDGVSCNVTPAVLTCPPTTWNGFTPATNGAIPFQFNTKVRVHHNMLYNNASIGDALFSGTPAGAGGITVSSGADGYQIDHNWIAGNLSTGDGGGVQHLGLSFQGKIDHNFVLYNQSTNPTLPTNGGGVVIEGANLDRQLNGNECGSTNDQDCPPGLGEGTGFGLVIDANLILGNSAESGSGGGLRIQQVNASELVAFPRTSNQWYDVTITNNIIANNVAGWDGGGVSIQDAMRVTMVNNTIASNDTTASAGVLFKTLGAVTSATPPPGCTPTTDPSLPQNPNCTGADAPHAPQPAGLVVQAHTPNLLDAIAAVVPAGGTRLTCPANFGYSATNNGDCMALSKPRMINDLFWQNRAFRVDVVSVGTGLQSQQNLVALSPALVQTTTGQCAAGANYWDVGLRTDDLAAGTIAAGTKVTMSNSLYTSDTQGVITGSANIVGGSSPVVAQFCNGARMPPEHCTDAGIDANSPSCKGFNAPPGASETTSTPTLFVFNGIQPTATVDEGHNWLNLSFGPLQLGRPNAATATGGELMLMRNGTGSANAAYSIPGGSSAVFHGSTTSGVALVATDFFGTPRVGRNDIGAAQFAGALPARAATLIPNPVAFGNWATGTNATMDVLVTNTGSGPLTTMTFTGLAAPFTRITAGVANSCGTTLNSGSSCTYRVQFAPAATGNFSQTLTLNAAGGPPLAVASTSVTGTGVAARATVTATPNPLTITVPRGQITGLGTVTVTNTAPAGTGAQMSISSITASPTNLQFSFVAGGGLGGFDNCTGTILAPGASCTVSVRFTTLVSPRGVTRNGTLTINDNGAGTPQTVVLHGFATP